MKPWIEIMMVLSAVSTLSSAKCGPHEHDVTGEGFACCAQCPPGTGVFVHCSNSSNTVCEPCQQGVSFNDHYTHTHRCTACSKSCPPNSRMKTACNVTHDLECQCRWGYYSEERSSECVQCALCGHGSGVIRPCEPSRNTVCRKCKQGTYSGVLSSTQACMPCTKCKKEEEVLKECTPIQDTICVARNGRAKKMEGEEPGKLNIIPVYCALLVAVIVGLLFYVGLRHWKIRNQHLKASDTQQPKCSTDSGIYMAAELPKKLPLDKEADYSIRDLSPDCRRELESLLNSQGDWRELARELVYYMMVA